MNPNDNKFDSNNVKNADKIVKKEDKSSEDEDHRVKRYEYIDCAFDEYPYSCIHNKKEVYLADFERYMSSNNYGLKLVVKSDRFKIGYDGSKISAKTVEEYMRVFEDRYCYSEWRIEEDLYKSIKQKLKIICENSNFYWTRYKDKNSNNTYCIRVEGYSSIIKQVEPKIESLINVDSNKKPLNTNEKMFSLKPFMLTLFKDYFEKYENKFGDVHIVTVPSENKIKCVGSDEAISKFENELSNQLKLITRKQFNYSQVLGKFLKNCKDYIVQLMQEHRINCDYIFTLQSDSINDNDDCTINIYALNNDEIEKFVKLIDENLVQTSFEANTESIELFKESFSDLKSELKKVNLSNQAVYLQTSSRFYFAATKPAILIINRYLGINNITIKIFNSLNDEILSDLTANMLNVKHLKPKATPAIDAATDNKEKQLNTKPTSEIDTISLSYTEFPYSFIINDEQLVKDFKKHLLQYEIKLVKASNEFKIEYSTNKTSIDGVKEHINNFVKNIIKKRIILKEAQFNLLQSTNSFSSINKMFPKVELVISEAQSLYLTGYRKSIESIDELIQKSITSEIIKVPANFGKFLVNCKNNLKSELNRLNIICEFEITELNEQESFAECMQLTVYALDLKQIKNFKDILQQNYVSLSLPIPIEEFIKHTELEKAYSEFLKRVIIKVNDAQINNKILFSISKDRKLVSIVGEAKISNTIMKEFEDFLNKHSITDHVIDLCDDDLKYLYIVKENELIEYCKQINKDLDVKARLSFENTNFKLENIRLKIQGTQEAQEIIEKKIQSLINIPKELNYWAKSNDRLFKYLSMDRFRKDLYYIAKDTRCLIINENVSRVSGDNDLANETTKPNFAESNVVNPKFPKLDVPIKIEVGSIADEKYAVNVIVNTTGDELDLSKGTVSKILLKLAGKTIQDELKKKYPHGLRNELVAISSAGNIKSSKFIFHVSLLEYQDNNNNVEIKFKKTVEEILRKAEKKNCTSIAFPALGTGILKYPTSKVAEWMFSSIYAYFNENNKNTKLNSILIVLYDAHVVDDFKRCEQKYKNELNIGTVKLSNTADEKKKNEKENSSWSIWGKATSLLNTVMPKYPNDSDNGQKIPRLRLISDSKSNIEETKAKLDELVSKSMINNSIYDNLIITLSDHQIEAIKRHFNDDIHISKETGLIKIFGNIESVGENTIKIHNLLNKYQNGTMNTHDSFG